MLINKKGVVISGFAGIGKSGLKDNVPYYENVKIYDLSSTYFRKESGWEKIYCDLIEALVDKYDYIFISAHQVVIDEMISRGNDFFIVYPKKYCKDEYRQRFIDRGDSREYVEKFMKKWEMFIDMLDNVNYSKKITLRCGQYLSDVLNRLR